MVLFENPNEAMEDWVNIIFLLADLFCNCVADEEKRLNATYIISVARKLGCSIFLLPEDIMEVVAHVKLVYTFNHL